MTPNTRAKIAPALLLALPAPLTCFLPAVVGLPFANVFTSAVAATTAVLALALAGAKDEDPARTHFYGGAPAYWVAATVWLVATIAAALVPAVPGAGMAARWVILAAAAIAALADFGSRVKNR